MPTSGLAQLSYAALQIQQQQQQQPVSTSPSTSNVARTITIESTPVSSPRLPTIVPHQRVRLSNSCSVVKTIKCTTVTYPNSTSTGSPIVVVSAPGQPNHRRLIAATVAPPPAGFTESSGDSTSSFPLDTAVMKARNQAAAAVSKEAQDTISSSQPHHPRRVVIVSAQDPPNSKS